MIRLQRILFPVDMSGSNRATVPVVKDLAKRFEAELLVLHVLEPPVSMLAAPDAGALVLLEQSEEIRQIREAAFESFLTEAFAGTSIKHELIEGSPAQEIVDYASKNKVDLIMMPTHGHGPIRRFLLGSVTAKVLHDSDIPVWTGAHTTEVATPVGPYRQILCAVDVHAIDVPVIQWAAAFASKEGAQLRLIHAVPSAANPSVESDRPVREKLFQMAHQEIEELQKSAGTTLEVIVHGGKPEHAIHDAVQDLGADLVIIGRGILQHPLGRLRSHAYSIIRESPCPVISI